jgi:molecular chaperone GrpE
MTMDEEFNEFIKGPSGTDSDLLSRLEEAEQGVNRLREALQRTRAEHLNYKRRMEESEAQRAGQAAARLASSLLSVLDDLERAAGAGPDGSHLSVGTAQDKVWQEGMELIRAKLMSVLEREGVRRIEAVGEPFNPVLHEAVAPHPTETLREDTIVAVQQHGYTLNGTLLRPARVTVAKRPGPKH